MLKSYLKKAYELCPFGFKHFVKDWFFYLKSKNDGGVAPKAISFSRNSKKVVVVGNGPSLKVDKLTFESLTSDCDFVCVNNFCDDNLFPVIKPSMYVFLDSYFFSDKAHADWVDRRLKTFKILNEKTTWPMTIILPHNATKSILESEITNPHIKIIKIATQSLFTEKYTSFVGKLFDHGIYGPPQVNVLIYAIYLSIWAGYKEIDVYGADLSFHKDVDIDQQTNELCITHRHFNEPDTVEVLRKNPGKIEKWTMSELLQLSADTFNAHEVMAQYAATKGTRIFNSSHYSLIDAYPRRKN